MAFATATTRSGSMSPADPSPGTPDPRQFRADLRAAFQTPAATVEANYRQAISRFGTAEASRMLRTGHPDIGLLADSRTASDRMRLLDAAIRAAEAGQRIYEGLGAPRYVGSQPGAPERAAHEAPGRVQTLAGIPVDSLGRRPIIQFTHDPGAFVRSWERAMETTPRDRGEALRTAAVLRPEAHAQPAREIPAAPVPASPTAPPRSTEIRAEYDRYAEEMARRTQMLPRDADELAGRGVPLPSDLADRLLDCQSRFRQSLQAAFVDGAAAERAYHRMAATDPRGVAERVVRNPELLGILRPGDHARGAAQVAALAGGEAYRIHLARTPDEAERLRRTQGRETATPQGQAEREKRDEVRAYTPMDYTRGPAVRDPQLADLLAKARVHERAQAIAAEASPLQEARVGAHQMVTKIRSRDEAAQMASDAFDQKLSRHFSNPAEARRSFQQDVALRGPREALATLTNKPGFYGTVRGRPSPDERSDLWKAAREELASRIAARAPITWKDPEGRTHLGREAVLKAATDTITRVDGHLTTIRGDLEQTGGLTRNRSQILETLRNVDPERRLELSRALGDAAPSLRPQLLELSRTRSRGKGL